jgi:hypothetical protein
MVLRVRGGVCISRDDDVSLVEVSWRRRNDGIQQPSVLSSNNPAANLPATIISIAATQKAD